MDITVKRGDIINFTWVEGRHNIYQTDTFATCTPSDPLLFFSGDAVLPPFNYLLSIDDSFSQNTTYFYACGVHCPFQAGRIFVVNSVECTTTSTSTTTTTTTTASTTTPIVTTPALNCLYDFNEDGFVNDLDVDILTENWLNAGQTDVNQDGTTDALDSFIVLNAYGGTCAIFA